MYELEKFLAEIANTDNITLNGTNYAVKNCVAAAEDSTIRMCIYVTNQAGNLIKIFVESVNLGVEYGYKN